MPSGQGQQIVGTYWHRRLAVQFAAAMVSGDSPPRGRGGQPRSQSSLPMHLLGCVGVLRASWASEAAKPLGGRPCKFQQLARTLGLRTSLIVRCPPSSAQGNSIRHSKCSPVVGPRRIERVDQRRARSGSMADTSTPPPFDCYSRTRSTRLCSEFRGLRLPAGS